MTKTLTRKALTATFSAASELSGSLESIRARIASLTDKRREVERLDVDKAAALARLDAWAADIRERGIGSFPLHEFIHPSGRGRVDINQAEPGLRNAFMLSASIDTVRDCWAERIEEHFNGCTGITDSERQAKLDTIDAEILDLSLAEEALIRATERMGMNILRRSDALPSAVLAHDEAMPE